MMLSYVSSNLHYSGIVVKKNETVTSTSFGYNFMNALSCDIEMMTMRIIVNHHYADQLSACLHMCFVNCSMSPHSHGLQSTRRWQWALVGKDPSSSSRSPFPGPPLCSVWPPLDPHPDEHCTAPSHGSSLCIIHKCIVKAVCSLQNQFPKAGQ